MNYWAIPGTEKEKSVSYIGKVVAKEFKITFQEMISIKAYRKYVEPRQYTAALSCDLTSKTLDEIGKELGGLSKVAIFRDREKIKGLIKVDRFASSKYKRLEKILKQKP